MGAQPNLRRGVHLLTMNGRKLCLFRGFERRLSARKAIGSSFSHMDSKCDEQQTCHTSRARCLRRRIIPSHPAARYSADHGE